MLHGKAGTVSSSSLRIAYETLENAIVVRVAGDIDLLTAPDLREGLELACAKALPPDVVVAELSEVRFMGSSALAVLMDVDQRCRAQRTPLWIVAATAAVMRPLEATGLDRILSIVGSLDGVTRTA